MPGPCGSMRTRPGTAAASGDASRLMRTQGRPSSVTDLGELRVAEGGRGDLDMRYPWLQIDGREQGLHALAQGGDEALTGDFGITSGRAREHALLGGHQRDHRPVPGGCLVPQVEQGPGCGVAGSVVSHLVEVNPA